ncbi:MAG: 4-alpha-glucanotransferase [Pirellulaceae bacterium]|nr:4-alpha-glucanotransferase [Pirellulaceae bacterium]
MFPVRCSGILLHVTSLPSPHGIGDLGAEAVDFVEALGRARQGIWQVLPLGPTGYGDSPYQCFSAFAGNPLLVDLRELAYLGWLTPADFHEAPDFDAASVNFGRVVPWKLDRLRRAFARFRETATAEQMAEQATFRDANRLWLDDYALFMALKHEHYQVEWTRWPAELALREPAALGAARERLAAEIDYHVFGQWCFARQWTALRAHANARGVRIIGDLPIFVAHDSADVWAGRELFLLEANGWPRVVAGVPPDYFSATGQLWGNPLYDWARLAELGYEWWLQRLAQATRLFDYVRIDHFRGFVANWEIPREAPTAASGRWAPGPGAALFATATSRLGLIPLIAEDLGVITPQVESLRDEFAYPGMRILQFAFGTDPKAPDYLPHNFIPGCAVYTGTHDNDTTVGWFHSAAGEGTTRTAEQIAAERQRVLRYLGTDGSEIHWDLIRLALSSVAKLAVFPMQDVLGLGSSARMNMPGTTAGNWQWRLPPTQFTLDHEARLAELSAAYERQLFPAATG